ncbi:head-tail connector protein [Pseudomonas kuykendallii]|uniref:head-tail connector protein n=1 Tax=Pseudomonas kuykendallii TaxID=1007099 RepID=UPI0028D33E64|nr:head-tail connector protein [Pseudomonas kuykendallii]
MPVPTLADFKRHLRIRHAMEDDDLQEKLNAAIDQAAQFLNRPIPWPVDPLAEVPVPADVPASVRAAILILGAELYANRERGIVGTSYNLMPTATNLLNPFRVNLGV